MMSLPWIQETDFLTNISFSVSGKTLIESFFFTLRHMHSFQKKNFKVKYEKSLNESNQSNHFLIGRKL